jgi:uncharacterized membrane protein
MTRRHSRTTLARLALATALPVLLLLSLGIAGPVQAQSNSPSGGQPTGDAPAQGGTSSDTPSNVGGDGQSGNRTTPGGGGATGGGSSGGGESDTADGGNAGPIIGVVALLAVVAVGIMIATRHRRVMEDAGAGPQSGR